MSELNSSHAQMLADIANSYGASPTVSPAFNSPGEIVGAWHAATVGGSNPHLRMTFSAMIAAIRNEICGAPNKSNLFTSVPELLADIATTASGSTASALRSSVGKILSIIDQAGGA